MVEESVLTCPSLLGKSMPKEQWEGSPPHSSTAGASRHQRRASPHDPRARVKKTVRPEPVEGRTAKGER